MIKSVDFEKQFQKDAVRRGYKPEQQQKYINDRVTLHNKTSLIQDAVILGAAVGTAGKVAYDAKVKKMGFKEAIKKQFAPLRREVKKIDFYMEDLFKPSKNKMHFVKKLAKEAVDTAIVTPFRLIKGAAMSIPTKLIAIPAAIILTTTAIKYNLEIAKINKRHDAIKTNEQN